MAAVHVKWLTYSLCHVKDRSAKSVCVSNKMEESTANHLSSYHRQRIIHFWREGKNVTEIICEMKSEGRRTSRATVPKWIFR